MRSRKIGSKDLRAICTVCGLTTSMDLITSRFTPNSMPGDRLIWRSKLNLTSSPVSSPKPLWNWTPFLSLNVHTVPSGESVQLSARSGSTSAVVTLPSLMAKRVSPRYMKRLIAWVCPRMLVCGSRESGSLAAMFRTFFCASATGVARTLTAANTDRSTRDTGSQADRDIGLSPFAARIRTREWPIPYTNCPPATRDGASQGPRGISDARLTHQPGAAVERWQHLVGLRRRQIEDEAGHTGVAVALDEVPVFRHAEDRDGQRRRVAPGLGDELPEIREKTEHVAVFRPARVRHPAVTEGARPPRAVGERAAHDRRRVRLLRRLRPGHHRRELDELAVGFRFRLRPDRPHRLDALPHHPEARLEVRAVVGHLLGVPAGADAEEEPSARDLVEARDLLGGLDRIALHDEAHPGGDLQPGGGRGGGRERHEGVHHVVVLLRQLTALWKRRAARQRDMRVLRRPERAEPALLQRPAELGRAHRVVREEDRRAEVHVSSYFHGGPEMAPIPPHVRHAPAKPWRASISLIASSCPRNDVRPRPSPGGRRRRRRRPPCARESRRPPVPRPLRSRAPR